MMVLFLLWSWIYLKLLPSTLLMYQLLLFSPLLLVAKIPLHSVEFNHCRSWRGERKKKEYTSSDAAGRQREAQSHLPSKNLWAGFVLSQVQWAFSIPWDTPSTKHCLSMPAFAPHCGSQGLRVMERRHEQSQGRIPGCHVARKWKKE